MITIKAIAFILNETARNHCAGRRTQHNKKQTKTCAEHFGVGILRNSLRKVR
jgi:hypothetical protein